MSSLDYHNPMKMVWHDHKFVKPYPLAVAGNSLPMPGDFVAHLRRHKRIAPYPSKEAPAAGRAQRDKVPTGRSIVLLRVTGRFYPVFAPKQRHLKDTRDALTGVSTAPPFWFLRPFLCFRAMVRRPPSSLTTVETGNVGRLGVGQFPDSRLHGQVEMNR